MAKLAPTVIAFRQQRPPTPEVCVAVAKRATTPEALTCEPGVDLSGKPKIVFLIGPGRSGKTTLARFLIERGQGAGRQAVLAALDPVNRTLLSYFDGVETPPHGATPADCARFLGDLLDFSMKGKHSAVVDLGGGDTTLAAVLEEMPNLADVLAEAGTAAVALYLLTPRIDDTAAFLQLGFLPEATAFVCNQVYGNAFEDLLEQEAVRNAIAGGARVVQMPRLDTDTMALLERMRPLSFARASRAEGGLGPWRASYVRNWLSRMDQAFAGIETWLA